MSDLNRNRHRWSWRNCFAIMKYNGKSRKYPRNSQQKLTSCGENSLRKVLTAAEENNEVCQSLMVNDQQKHTETLSFLPIDETHNDSHAQYFLPHSCIIKIESPSAENETTLIDVDTIEQLTVEDIDGSTMNSGFSSALKQIHLDAIIEDSNEENSDDLDETIQPVRLCCDREIVHDTHNLHSRLLDLSHMNHVITQFKENGNLLAEFTKQIDRLKTKADDITRASAQMPRDAELLEARYSTLLSTIESLSLLLKIAQIPASRPLINRLVFTIEQRMEQLRKLIQLSSALSSQGIQHQDFNDEDFLSFRSALSSYEHLFSMS